MENIVKRVHQSDLGCIPGTGWTIFLLQMHHHFIHLFQEPDNSWKKATTTRIEYSLY